MTFAQLGLSSNAVKDIVDSYMALGRTKEAIIPLANSVKALNASQQALVLSNNGVSESMIREILKTNEVSEADINAIMVKRALSNSYKKLTKAQLSEIITAQTGDAAKTKAILIELGLVDAKDTDTISTQNLSRANVEATLAQQGLTTAQAEAITVQMGLATKVGKTTNIFEGMLISAGDLLSQAWQFIRSYPALTVGLAAVAVGFKIVSSYIKKTEEETQKAINSGDELKDYISDVNQYISQIKNLRETLDSTDSSYEDQKQAREELLRIQDEMIQKYGDEIKKLDLMKGSVEGLSDAIFNSTTKSEADQWLVDNSSAIKRAEKTVDTYGVDFIDNLKERITTFNSLTTESVSDFNAAVKEAGEALGADVSDYYANNKDEIEDKQKDLLDYLQKYYNTLTGENGGMFELVPDDLEKLANLFGKGMFDSGSIIGDVDEDIEIFKKSGYYKLISEMPDLYNKMTAAVERYNKAVSEGDTAEQVKALEDIKSIYQDTYSTSPNSAVSWYIRDTLEQYISSATDAENDLRELLQNRTQRLANIFGSINWEPMQDELLNGTDTERLKRLDNGDGTYYVMPDAEWMVAEITPELNDEEFETLLKLVQGEIGKNIDWLHYSPESLKNLVQALTAVSDGFNVESWYEENGVEDITKQLDKLKTLYKTVVEGGQVSIDDLKDFPELTQYVNDSQALKEHIQELASTKVAPLIEDLRSLEGAAAAAGDNETVEILQNIIELLFNEVDVTGKINDAYAEQKQLIKENIHVLNDQIKKEEERKERLQDQKEELEGQKEALEKQKKAVEKSYQAQIDALDDEIEKLRDEADEQERVNDLKEKELALEKAKQTQVRRYSSARGWTVETNTEAVNQAQKEYDDAVRESQIDELEKQKKELERQKEAASESYESQIENIEDQINALEDQIDAVDAEIEKYKSLKDEQNSYLSFYKTYSADFATATGKQAEALGKLNQALEKYRDLSDLPEIQRFYEEAMKQYSDAYDGYSQGGVVTYNGLAQLHGANGAELVLNNNDVGKIYQMIHGSTAAQLVNTMAQNSIKKATSATDNLNSPGQHGNNSYTWQLSGNNIIVDSYEKFKGYMDRYVREAKQNLVVGR